MKRRQDWDAPAAKRGGGGGRRVDAPCVLKVLTPEVLASAVIGKGGAVVKEIRDATGARLGFTDHGEVYPDTDCRVLTTSAGTETALNEVMSQVIAKTGECAEAGAADLGQGGVLTVRTLVPRLAVSGLIGRGGSGIKGLREASGCKISIADALAGGQDADQVVAITGARFGLEQVMAEVVKKIHELHQEAWFESWASNPGTIFAQGGGGGRGGYERAPRQDAYYGGGGGGAAPAATQWGAGGGGGRGGGGAGGGWQDGGGASHPGVGNLISVASGLPGYVLDDSRGFALSCVVPNRLVGGLIGRGGTGTKEIQAMTGTKIGIREIAGDPDNRSLNIAGALGDACAAYMLMMKRYLDAEAQDAAAPR